jgi:hypothetical protein
MFARAAFVFGAVALTLLLVPGAAGVATDTTPPEITPITYGTHGNDDGMPVTDGWYVSNVTLNWTVVDPESPIRNETGCDAITLTADTPGKKFTCYAESDGGETTKSKTITLDKTPPAVGASPDRAPDANGWYNHALTVRFSGTDGTSGIDSCASVPYGGPDGATVSVSGGCRDKAGNAGGTAFSLNYDATPPKVTKVVAKTGNRKVDVAWAGSSDVTSFQVARTGVARGARTVSTATIYSGSRTALRDRSVKVGARYRYTVNAFDQAANRASKSVVVTATGALLSPPPGARVGSAPMLVWTPVKGAKYYNLQLVRGRKIFSAWPASAHFRLPRSWVFGGHRYRLHRGVYKWFVWPGFGTFKSNRYGSLLGGSSFFFSG